MFCSSFLNIYNPILHSLYVIHFLFFSYVSVFIHSLFFLTFIDFEEKIEELIN